MNESVETRLARLGDRLDREGALLEERILRGLDSAPQRAPVTPLPARPRSRRGLVGVAALLVVLLVGTGGWIATHRRSTSQPKVSTPATQPTGPASSTTNTGSALGAACQAFDAASTKRRAGKAGDATMIRNIDIQTSQCGTTAYFLAGAGRWNIRYSTPTSTTLIARLDGAHAFVSNGGGFIPDTYTLDPPSVVTELTRVRHRNDGNDPGTTWSLHLDKRRPFTAGQTTIGGTTVFAINIAAPTTDTLRCHLDPHIEITVPTGWHAEATPCGAISPEPIAHAPNIGNNAAVTLIAGSQFPHGVQDVGGPKDTTARQNLGDTTINGRPAARTLFTYTASAQDIYQQYQVVIQWDPTTTVVVYGLTRPFPPHAPTREAMSLPDLEAMVNTIANSANTVP